MSFDLYVFPRPAPENEEELEALIEAEEERAGTDVAEPGPEMEAFLAELERRWPLPDDDEGGSPWAFWPLWQPLGSGTMLNIAWPRAEEMTREVVTIADQAGLAVFDPQEGRLLN